MGKREGLYIHFLFLPQRNRRWPRGLEGDFRASMGEDVMACKPKHQTRHCSFQYIARASLST